MFEFQVNGRIHAVCVGGRAEGGLKGGRILMAVRFQCSHKICCLLRWVRESLSSIKSLEKTSYSIKKNNIWELFSLLGTIHCKLRAPCSITQCLYLFVTDKLITIWLSVIHVFFLFVEKLLFIIINGISIMFWLLLDGVRSCIWCLQGCLQLSVCNSMCLLPGLRITVLKKIVSMVETVIE